MGRQPTAQSQSLLQRTIYPLLIVLVLGTTYVVTLLPDVGFSGDTAKFQFVGYFLGTPHTTGYPTYVGLNFLFTHLFPFGSLAYRANLLSALFAIGAALVLYATLRRLNIARNVACVSVLAFGFSYTFWLHALVAEVYTLNVLFVSLVLYCFLSWHLTRETRYLLLGCLAYAFSFGNHITMITFLPALVYLVLATNWRVLFDVRLVALVLLYIALGAAQYGYLFWRAAQPDPVYVEMDPTDLGHFLWLMSGGPFHGHMLAFSPRELLAERLPMLKQFVQHEYPFLLALMGLGMLLLRPLPLNFFLLLGIVGNVGFALSYDIPDIFVYFLPTYFILAIYLAQALNWIHHRLQQDGLRLPIGVMLLLPLMLFALRIDQIRDPLTITDKDVVAVQEILQTLEQDAVIVAPSYPYAQYFWYYLLVDEWQAEQNIYLAFEYRLDEIHAYVREDKPIYMPSQKAYIPVGLELHVADENQRNLLIDAGFELTEVADNLYRVE